MKLSIDNHGDYELIEINNDSFIVNEKKLLDDTSLVGILLHKDGWNDPNLDSINRTFKAIKMNGKFYALRKIQD